jgi:hypothetical protein
MSNRLWAVSCLLVTAIAMGCGHAPPPIVIAEGTIQIDNKPLNKVEVRFIPVSEFGPEYTAKGVTDEHGRYKLITKGEPGVCACECYVVIVEPEIPPNLRGESPQTQAELERYLKALGNRPLPRKYGNIAETPLRVTVSADRKDYDFQLKHD